MAEWVGMLGGLLMVLTVLLFAWLLMSETGLIKTGRTQVLRHASRVSLWIIFCLLLQLGGALFCYLSSNERSVWDPDLLWINSACAVQMPLLENSASFSELLQQGVLPGMKLLYRLIGRILLNSHHQGLLYMGIICGGFSLWSAEKLWPRGWLCACLPCIVLLSLPSSFSLVVACMFASMLLDASNRKNWCLFPTLLSALIHPFGFCIFAVQLFSRFRPVSAHVRLALICLCCWCAGILLQWYGWEYEAVVMTGLALLPLADGYARKRWFLPIPVLLALGSAVCMGLLI